MIITDAKIYHPCIPRELRLPFGKVLVDLPSGGVSFVGFAPPAGARLFSSSLVFQPMHKMHWLVPSFCNRLSRYTRKAWKVTVLNRIFKASALWADAFSKSICPYVCHTFEVPFNGLFAPTFRSQMSNIFRDSESLGKSNGKKWCHI